MRTRGHEKESLFAQFIDISIVDINGENITAFLLLRK